MAYDITSASNEQIKWLLRLRERAERDSAGLFIVEGERLYRRALEAGLEPVASFTDGTVGSVGETVTVQPSVLDRASYRQRSQGIIGVFPQFETTLDGLRPGAVPLILVAEDIEKPGNLGAMMRTAAAAGADGLITVGASVDPFNANVVRSATGALFTLPVAVSYWESVEPWLERRGIEVVGASPDADTPLWQADLTGAVALVIGAEDIGLSVQAASIAARTMRIPQSETGVDSLNASVAAAVLLYEAVRQRTGG